MAPSLVEDGRITAVGEATPCAPAPQARVHDYGKSSSRPASSMPMSTTPRPRSSRVLGQAADRLAEHLHLPRGDALRRPAYADEIANRYLDLSSRAAPPPSAPTPRSTPKAWTRSFPPPRRAACASLPARPAWTATPPKACATRRNRPMTTARRFCKMARGGPPVLCHHPALLAHLHARTAGGPGALWREYPDCLMQTHLSEQTDEIAWVRDLFPQSRDYLDTYEAQGLLREGRRLRPRHPPDRPRKGPADRGRGQPCPLPDLEHLHRLGPVRHGPRAVAARRTCHRHRRRLVLLHAAHHGRRL
jgi:guanine deaminase